MAGSTGVLPPPKGYLQKLRQICDRHGILLIFDEVISGFGRLGFAFAAERYGVVPDMITFAKGVTSGAVPMGGVIVRKGIHDAFMKGPEHVASSSSTATPIRRIRSRCAAALATLDLYRDEKLFERARKLEPIWADAIDDAQRPARTSRHPHPRPRRRDRPRLEARRGRRPRATRRWSAASTTSA